MRCRTHTLWVLLALALSLPACHGQAELPASKPVATGQTVKTLDGETVAISELEAFKTQTMTKANVAGLSCAIIQDDDMRFVFVKDAAGKISGLNIELQGLVLSAQKVD